MTEGEPYGDFLPYDPECPRVKDLERDLGRDLDDHQAQRHRAICERCMMLAVLASEIVLEPPPGTAGSCCG